MPSRVAIQGELGSFSHQAARTLAPDAEVVACRVSAEVFAQLTNGAVGAIVIPIENSLAGAVVEHYDLLRQHPVTITAESWLRIRHNLIAAPEVSFAAVRHAYSHPVALAQCKQFFAEHPQIAPEAFYDTAGAVKHVIKTASKDAAGIASELAAEIYGGNILRRGIEDSEENFTRFLHVRRGEPSIEAGSANKMSLSFEVKDHAGALAKVLSAFAAEGTNLTALQTRPVAGKPGHYTFFVDAVTENHSELVEDQGDLRKICTNLRVLGIYRAAPIVRD